ncbi:MAG: exopolysaccharide biosynthesis polyprenyl glycosylphosphotransferase [Micavibrio sp.]
MQNAPKIKRGIKRQVSRLLGAVVAAFDVLALWLAFLTTRLLSVLMVDLSRKFDWDYDFSHFDTRRYYYVFLCACAVFYFLAKGHYSRRIPFLMQTENIVRVILFAVLFDGFNYYFLDYSSFPSWMCFNWMLCFLYLLIGRKISFFLIKKSNLWPLPTVLAGDARTVLDCFYAFQADASTGYEIKHIFLNGSSGLIENDALFQKNSAAQIHSGYQEIPEFITASPGYYYIFTMDLIRGEGGSDIMAAANEAQVEYAVVPHTRAFEIFGMEAHYFFGNDVMVMHRRDPIRSPSGRAVKRAFDILVSGAGLVFLGILAAIVAIFKKAGGSAEPVFYGGERIGLNGKKFQCWKFRTMKDGADDLLRNILVSSEEARIEWERFQKLKNDPRVDSAIARFLRKTSLDEMPQLWNVFIGDMSLVGPRPILESQITDYGSQIGQYYSVRPGITGLWQVSGRNETTFEQRIYWDGWYIRNWSLWHDIVIMYKTVRVVIFRSGAY